MTQQFAPDAIRLGVEGEETHMADQSTTNRADPMQRVATLEYEERPGCHGQRDTRLAVTREDGGDFVIVLIALGANSGMDFEVTAGVRCLNGN